MNLRSVNEEYGNEKIIGEDIKQLRKCVFTSKMGLAPSKRKRKLVRPNQYLPRSNSRQFHEVKVTYSQNIYREGKWQTMGLKQFRVMYEQKPSEKWDFVENSSHAFLVNVSPNLANVQSKHPLGSVSPVFPQGSLLWSVRMPRVSLEKKQMPSLRT